MRRALRAQVGEARRRGGGVVLSLDVLGGGPEHHVAEHGRSDQHSLGDLRGHREDHVLDEPARELVEHDQLAAPRRDREAVVAEHAVELVRAQARGVDEKARGPGSPARAGHAQASPVQPLDRVHRRAAPQLAAGRDRLGGEGQRRGERADDPLVGDLQGASCAGAEVRLAPVELLHSQLADRLVAVGPRALDDPRELGELLLVPGHQQRPGGLDRYPDSLRVAAEQLVAAHHQPRLERARLGVEPGVQQRRVGLAGAGAHVRARLEQHHAQVEARELARDRAAHHSRPRDQDIGVEPALHAREYRRPSAQALTAPARARISSIDSSVQEAKKPPTTSRTSSSDSAR